MLPEFPMSSLPSRVQLDRFFLFSWLLACAQLASSQTSAQYAGFAVAAWSLATTLTYAFLYLLPAFAAIQALRRVVGGGRLGGGRGGRWMRHGCAGCSIHAKRPFHLARPGPRRGGAERISRPSTRT